MKRLLYISLTGMTEALGRSQVLEYLIDLSKTNEIFLISFEREYSEDEIKEIRDITSNYNITWRYLKYSNKYGVFSSIKQIVDAFFISKGIVKNYNISLVHSRSFIPAFIGVILKSFFKLKLIYDIRGFAIDEKLDRGRLKKNSFLFKVLKRIDNYIYSKSDHVVTLTHRAKDILVESMNIDKNSITVIPTCANSDLFKVLDEDENLNFKESLGFKKEDIIFIHTGTVSGWYDFDKELMVMKKLIKINPRIKLLILNKNEQSFISGLLEKYEINKKNVIVTSSSFNNVHKYLNISSYSIFFIKPSFSKQASAPTKFAENVACLIPSITNKDVGDMEYYINMYEVGLLFDLNNFNVDSIVNTIIESLDKIYHNNAFEELFKDHFDKNKAVYKYEQIYKELA